MTDLDNRAAEYAAAAKAWRAFCGKGRLQEATEDQPVSVVLLAALCEPRPYSGGFTGDLLADLMFGLSAFVRRIEAEAEEGVGGGLFLENATIEAWRRRLDALATLRGYEAAHRVHEGASRG